MANSREGQLALEAAVSLAMVSSTLMEAHERAHRHLTEGTEKVRELVALMHPGEGGPNLAPLVNVADRLATTLRSIEETES